MVHYFFFPQDAQEGEDSAPALPAVFEMLFKDEFHLGAQAITANFIADNIQEYVRTKRLIGKFHARPPSVGKNPPNTMFLLATQTCS
jgi:hypothetical protein